MGVEGLTTYLREHRLTVAKTIELQAHDSSPEKTIEIIVDGWSFIYTLHHASHIPWVYGGEYDQFSAAVRRTVEKWLNMGVNLSFVFDGAFEAHKIVTRLARQTNTTVHHSALFFRTSESSRQTARFLAETRILPPLIYAACVDTLKDMASQFRGTDRGGRLDIYFADREADPFVVELAGRLHAYIAALDSDFVILNTPGYQGYIPLDELEWVVEVEPDIAARTRTLSMASSTTSLFAPSEISASTDASIWNDIASQAIDEDADAGFVPVVKKRNKSKKTSNKPALVHVKTGNRDSHRSLIPPNGVIVALVLSVYTPDSTAASLGIATSLLPLLGAIVGNDATHSAKYTIPGIPTPRTPISSTRPTATHHEFLFERKMNAPQRVIYTANTLTAVLKQAGKKGGPKQSGKSILELIRSVIRLMLLRPRDTTDREIDEMINRIVDGALIYAIPPSFTATETKGRDGLWPTPFCALHTDLEQCRLDALIPEGDESDDDDAQDEDVRSIVQTQYLRWYREGSFDTNILDPLVTGTMWPRMFLESPDYSSASGPGEAGGALRKWAYAVLDQGVGIFVPTPPKEEEDEAEMEDASQAPQIDMQGEASDESEEDEDEVIGVVDEEEDDENEDPLMALKGALQRLRGTGAPEQGSGLPAIPDREEDEGESEDSEEDTQAVFVTEYVRRGARVTEERVVVEDLNRLLELKEQQKLKSGTKSTWRTSRTHPIQLEEEEKRLKVLLLACESDNQKIKALEKEWLGPVVVIRWLIHFAAMKERERGGDGSNTPTLLRKWTRREIKALLCAFNTVSPSEEQMQVEAPQEVDPIIVTERSVQLMARALSAVEALRMLVQVLGLSHRVPIRATNFGGRTFHSICNSDVPSSEIDHAVWDAVEEGLVECIGDDRLKRVKKKSGTKPADTGKSVAGTKRSMSTRGGMFSLLAEINS